MPRYETRSNQFGLVSGTCQPRSDMIVVAEPATLFAPEARKGQLYIIVEADQDLARGRDACQLVSRTIRKQFYENSSYSVTSALRKAVSAANTALYQHNFSVMAQKRAMVGVTCAVIKDNDLYLAQVAPTQAYILAEGKLRALPTNLSWNVAQAVPAPFFKPGALGSSLSVEPEFYRAVLRPGDALLLCSSNLARMLGRDEVMRLLRSPDPADMVEGLTSMCTQNALAEAHGLAVAICAPLSPAAQASPLSRAGVSERGRLALRSVGGWAARLTGEAALLVKGPGERARLRMAQSRREQTRREQEQLTRAPEEPPYSPAPPSQPRPLDLGPALDEQVEQARQERHLGRLGAAPRRGESRERPPSMFLGEGTYLPTPPPARRVDLSDTPGMAALGRNARPSAAPSPVDLTLGERVGQWFDRAAGALTGISRRRRLRRPPPSAMPQVRRQQGLSYRRQRPPFPFLLLSLLVSLVALLILYGTNLSRENALRQAGDSLARAEQAVASVRDAPDDASAQERLDSAAQAIAEVRGSGVVTGTEENRVRYEKLEREYERALAAVQKLTYFNDLTEIGTHPVPGGRFDTVVVPPPPGITNTESFGSIYALDTNAGLLYRMPKSGGLLEPFLRPNDKFGPLDVGMIKAQAWRVDNVVAIAQSVESGPFTFYFRNGESWSFSNLAGSEEWGNVGKHFHAVNYEGNLYIWGAAPGQVLKYFSGRYGEFPVPWVQSDGGRKLDDSIDLGVDGKVYLLQADGRILVFAANAFEREIAPPSVTPPLVTPAGFFVTGPPESGAIFLVDLNNERIIQIDKQTGALVQQIRARPDGPLRLDRLTGLYVDDSGGRLVLYLVNGGQLLRASLPDPPRPFHEPGSPVPDGTATPADEPTVTP